MLDDQLFITRLWMQSWVRVKWCNIDHINSLLIVAWLQRLWQQWQNWSPSENNIDKHLQTYSTLKLFQQGWMYRSPDPLPLSYHICGRPSNFGHGQPISATGENNPQILQELFLAQKILIAHLNYKLKMWMSCIKLGSCHRCGSIYLGVIVANTNFYRQNRAKPF